MRVMQGMLNKQIQMNKGRDKKENKNDGSEKQFKE